MKSVLFFNFAIRFFESLKLFLMREGFVFCSVPVVGFNSGALVNLVLPDFDSSLLSAPPQSAHIYTHKFEYRDLFILLIIVIPSPPTTNTDKNTHTQHSCLRRPASHVAGRASRG